MPDELPIATVVMKVIYNSIFPFGRYDAINICGVIFSKIKMSPMLARHEYIHTLQQREMLFLFFYLWYGVEWLVRIIAMGSVNKAYRNVSFEREAYANDHNPHYCSRRRFWAWLRYYK